MPISHSDLSTKISNAFPNSKFTLTDIAGDENHYDLEISGDEFSGINRVQQHRKVNQALKDCLGDELHALTVKFNKN